MRKSVLILLFSALFGAAGCAKVVVVDSARPGMHRPMAGCVRHHDQRMITLNDTLQTVRTARNSGEMNKMRDALNKAEETLQSQVNTMQMCRKGMRGRMGEMRRE